MVAGSMLLVSGTNVPLNRLPTAIRDIGSVIPLTHGIAAGRILAAGGSLAAAQHLLLTEALVGAVYFILGITMLRVLEYSGRRSAALETF
jgi:ABC-2 type transport system permease protein